MAEIYWVFGSKTRVGAQTSGRCEMKRGRNGWLFQEGLQMGGTVF